MKLQQNNDIPLTSGGMQMQDIGISDDPEDQKMVLEILTQSLYTDKISAVLREIGCNAADANTEAGKAHQPIEITLPSKLEPTLRIRDFGLGLNEDQIATVFCRLGKSTKRGSDAFTGMLGIGSKSPFAYGDSFLITSWVGGVKTTYNAFRDQGFPRLARMQEVPSDAPDGLEVAVPVRNQDINEFIEKAERVFHYFSVRPIFHGHKLDFKETNRLLAGKRWCYTGTGKSFAVMGNVGYELSASGMGLSSHSSSGMGLSSHSSEHERKAWLQYKTLSAGVELHFDIGELEVAANREGLQYRDQTRSALKSRLQIALKEAQKIFVAQLNAAPTFWEAHKIYARVRAGGLGVLISSLQGCAAWRGAAPVSHIFSLKSDDPEVNVSILAGAAFRKRFKIQKYAPRDCCASDMTYFLLNDLPGAAHSPSRYQAFTEAHPDARQLVVLKFGTPQAKAAFWKLRGLEGIPITLLSSVVPPPRTTTGASGSSPHNNKHSAKAFVLNEASTSTLRGRGLRSAWWDPATVDLKKDGGAYVVIRLFEAVTSLLSEHPLELVNKVVAMRKVGLLKGPVYGFKPGCVARLGPNWRPLTDHIRENLEQLVKKGGAQNFSDLVAALNYKSIFQGARTAPVFPNGTAARKFIDEFKRMSAGGADTREAFSLANGNSCAPWLVKPTLPPPTVDLKALEQQIYAELPILTVVDWHIVRAISNWTPIEVYARLMAAK